MPYTGRPSRGCRACKDRKVKVRQVPRLRLLLILTWPFSFPPSVTKRSHLVADVKEMEDSVQGIQL